jgi:hypothetical protein
MAQEALSTRRDRCQVTPGRRDGLTRPVRCRCRSRDRRDGGHVLPLWTALPLQAELALVSVGQLQTSIRRHLYWGAQMGNPLTHASIAGRPQGPCCLVGHRNRGTVEAASLPKLVHPLVRRIRLAGRCSHHRSSPMDDHCSQRLGTSLRDPCQHVPVSARVLTWDQAQPGR